MTVLDKIIDILAGLTMVVAIGLSLLRGHKKKSIVDSTEDDKNQDDQTSSEERSDDSEDNKGTDRV